MFLRLILDSTSPQFQWHVLFLLFNMIPRSSVYVCVCIRGLRLWTTVSVYNATSILHSWICVWKLMTVVFRVPHFSKQTLINLDGCAVWAEPGALAFLKSLSKCVPLTLSACAELVAAGKERGERSPRISVAGTVLISLCPTSCISKMEVYRFSKSSS